MINNTLYFLDIPENNNKIFIDLIKSNLDDNKIFPYDCCCDLFDNQHQQYLNLEKYDFFHGKFGIGFEKNFEEIKIITTIENPYARAKRILNDLILDKYKKFKIKIDKNDDFYNLINNNKYLFSNIQTKFLGLKINPLKLKFDVVRSRKDKFLFESWAKFNVACSDKIYSFALKALENLFFLGISEDIDSSINSFLKIMNSKLNWDYDILFEKFNIFKKFNNINSKKVMLSEKTKNLLFEINKYDFKLYNISKKIFAKKFKNIKFFI